MLRKDPKFRELEGLWRISRSMVPCCTAYLYRLGNLLKIDAQRFIPVSEISFNWCGVELRQLSIHMSMCVCTCKCVCADVVLVKHIYTHKHSVCVHGHTCVFTHDDSAA